MTMREETDERRCSGCGAMLGPRETRCAACGRVRLTSRGRPFGRRWRGWHFLLPSLIALVVALILAALVTLTLR